MKPIRTALAILALAASLVALSGAPALADGTGSPPLPPPSTLSSPDDGSY